MNYNTEMKFAELTETEVMNIEGGATYGNPGPAPKMTDYDMSTAEGRRCYSWILLFGVLNAVLGIVF